MYFFPTTLVCPCRHTLLPVHHTTPFLYARTSASRSCAPRHPMPGAALLPRSLPSVSSALPSTTTSASLGCSHAALLPSLAIKASRQLLPPPPFPTLLYFPEPKPPRAHTRAFLFLPPRRPRLSPVDLPLRSLFSRASHATARSRTPPSFSPFPGQLHAVDPRRCEHLLPRCWRRRTTSSKPLWFPRALLCLPYARTLSMCTLVSSPRCPITGDAMRPLRPAAACTATAALGHFRFHRCHHRDPHPREIPLLPCSHRPTACLIGTAASPVCPRTSVGSRITD